MREIKFRAWDKNEMSTTPIDTKYGLSRFFGRLSEDAILEQFTGLKDKNGVDIYEGDIVLADGINRIGEIYFQKFRASYSIKFSEFTNNDLFRYVQNGNTVEIIGNIHQNPELLNEP